MSRGGRGRERGRGLSRYGTIFRFFYDMGSPSTPHPHPLVHALVHTLWSTPTLYVLRPTRPRTVSNVVWACGRLGYATERLSTWAVGQVAEGRGLAHVSPQALSNLAWGLSRLGHRPQPALVAGIVEAALRCMSPPPAGGGSHVGSMMPSSGGGHRRNGGFKPEELSALLSGLATWNARPDVRLLVMTETELVAGEWMGRARVCG